MTTIPKALLAIASIAFAAQAGAQVVFYDKENFQGRSFTVQKRVADLSRAGFKERASSLVVTGQRWQVCGDTRLEGNCMVLRPGRYASFASIGLDERVASARPLPSSERVAQNDYAPLPPVVQDFSRRPNERLYDAAVTSSRAVTGTPGQRCWIESEQVVQQPAQQQAGLNLPGAAVGALIGGILGHQVGGGTGKQIATVGGVLGGAALGAQYGRGDAVPAQTVAQDVRRCDGNPVQATPAYWDVTYDFRGQEHRVQMTTAPGRTVVVNGKGEPRT